MKNIMLRMFGAGCLALVIICGNAMPSLAQECWEEASQEWKRQGLQDRALETEEWNNAWISFWEEITLEQIQTCLDNGADINARNWIGHTPLHSAARKSFEVINVLLKAGANLHARDAGGGTPLHQVAAFNENPKAITALLDAGADVNALDDSEEAPLQVAAFYNANPEVFVVLLNAGADVHVQDNWQGRTALHNSAILGDSSEVITILLKAGADINARDKDGNTPLHFAAKSTDPEHVTILLKAGADVRAKDKDGKTAFYYAQKNEFINDTKAYWALHDARY